MTKTFTFWQNHKSKKDGYTALLTEFRRQSSLFFGIGFAGYSYVIPAKFYKSWRIKLYRMSKFILLTKQGGSI